jgi:hypothetical protein
MFRGRAAIFLADALQSADKSAQSKALRAKWARSSRAILAKPLECGGLTPLLLKALFDPPSAKLRGLRFQAIPRGESSAKSEHSKAGCARKILQQQL